ncbi:uncharacterized protein PHACADRAFT_262252 [Phanerochaete carnosa HHB-10118-sp]|uniref:Uncharacterized protein n=1 Tax=Phanerochaete carnosa (strain HHB-10118-sp) TaxID=650164 RepID=K5UPY6_PHACS|nr:uncharacterized protein PHACADRAFT_262252 [Phanerochaete carnosa HHB-10118-sp]EKM51866.1 hypothetical protein PHACADRAFT_262252 [Phanerochaete carnosa HHB-10118-sp]
MQSYMFTTLTRRSRIREKRSSPLLRQRLVLAASSLGMEPWKASSKLLCLCPVLIHAQFPDMATCPASFHRPTVNSKADQRLGSQPNGDDSNVNAIPTTASDAWSLVDKNETMYDVPVL